LVAVKVAVVFQLLEAMAAQVVADIHHQAQAVQDRKAATVEAAQALDSAVVVAAEMVMALPLVLRVLAARVGFLRLPQLITQVVVLAVTQTYLSLGALAAVVTPVLRLLHSKAQMV
jgi:hypothetical protein